MIHLLCTLVLIVFPAMLIVAALKDVTSFTIPNWIALTIVGGFPLAALAAQLPLAVAGTHLLVGLLGLALGIGLYAIGWMGGGDAKLLAAAGLWLGWPAAGLGLGATCMAGGVLAAGLLALRAARVYALLPAGGPAWLVRLSEPGGSVPYGVAIAVGALAALPSSGLAVAP